MPSMTSKISSWKDRSNPKMLGLFSRHHAPQKSLSSIDSLDDNLTALDPPLLNGVPYYANGSTTTLSPQRSIATLRRSSVASQQFGHLAQKHAMDFTKRAVAQDNITPGPSPTDSEFSGKNYNIVSNGLQGEKERNMILEEQVKMLSHQAALALDRLSEVSKENEHLKEENDALSKKASRFSFVNRQGSVASSQSSVFSKEHGTMSQTSSMSSIQSHLRRSSTYLEEMSQSYEKEMNTMKKQLFYANQELAQSKEQLKILSDEASKLNEQLIDNTHTITELKSQIQQLTTHLEASNQENSKLWKRFSTKKKQSDLEIQHCKKQLADLVEQLMARQQQDLNLRQRLMEYDECNVDIRTTTSMLTSM